jgi:deoxyguanosine kinase
MDYRYIVVEGPIGVGKTSLSNLLSERFRARRILEVVEENPFLSSFYTDRDKYAFQTQIFFLLSRFRQQQELFQQDLFNSVTVSDYLFAKDRIFACLTLDPNELSLYDRVFEALGPRVAKPDLVIYLQARLEVLLQRIKKRGREFERKFDPVYLEEL